MSKLANFKVLGLLFLFFFLSVSIQTLRAADLPSESIESKAYREGQCFEMGLNGEIIFGYGCGDFVILEREKHLVISMMTVETLSNGRNRYSWKEIYVAEEDGSIQAHDSKRAKGVHSLRALPREWPVRDESGSLRIPKDRLIVSTSVFISTELRDKPEGTVGYYVLLAIPGVAIAPHSTVKAPDNVLWIVPLNPVDGPEKGFQLIHSGPLHQGIYATVYEDRTVKFGEGAVNVDELKATELYWRHIESDMGRLFVPINGHRLGFFVSDIRERAVWKDGQPFGVSGPSVE